MLSTFSLCFVSPFVGYLLYVFYPFFTLRSMRTSASPVGYEDLLGKTGVTSRVNRRTVVVLELQSTTPEGIIWAAQSFIQRA